MITARTYFLSFHQSSGLKFEYWDGSIRMRTSSFSKNFLKVSQARREWVGDVMMISERYPSFLTSSLITLASSKVLFTGPSLI